MIGLLYGWGGFYLQKVLLASMGYAQAAITLIVATWLLGYRYTSLDCARKFAT